MDNQTINPKKLHLTPMDFFLYAGFVITLITVVVSFINLSFNILENFFPDPLNSYTNLSNGVQSSMAFLIIAFPILCVLAVFIRKTINKDIQKSELGLRKWVIYGILFISGLIALGDIITLVRYFLMGDLGSLFVCKILIVLLTAVVLFVYFIHQLTYENSWSKKSVKVFEWVSIVLFVMVITIGFLVMGSPVKQRQIRFDEQRINDLQNIQWQIINYYQQHGFLPDTLNKISDPLSDYIIPLDPELNLGKKYDYFITKDKYEFSLCSNFNLSSNEINKYKNNISNRNVYLPSNAMEYGSKPIGFDTKLDNWAHDMGYYCFSRIIDPIKYPLNNKK